MNGVQRIIIEKGEPQFGEGNRKVTVVFDDLSKWIPRMSDVERICIAFSISEEKKYKHSRLGKNFFFLSHLFPIYKDFLLQNGFKPDEKDLLKTAAYRTLSKVEIIDISGDD